MLREPRRERTDRIEQERQGHSYLVGDAFTVADLTAAALLGPYCI